MCRLGVIFIILLGSNIVWAGPYSFNTKKELTLLGLAGGGAAIGLWRDGEKDNPTLADLNGLNKQDLWGIDRHYAGRWDPDAHQMSNVVLTTALLSPALMMIKEHKEAGQIGLLFLETQAVILSGISLSKGLVTRYRPFTYGTDAPLEERLDADATRSFFSGHSATITGGLVFTAKVFSDYYPRSKYKYWVWGGGLALAAYGSWQRVEAGRHFPTDVLTGMSWGAAVAYLIPESHKSDKKRSQWLPLLRENTVGLSWQREF